MSSGSVRSSLLLISSIASGWHFRIWKYISFLSVKTTVSFVDDIPPLSTDIRFICLFWELTFGVKVVNSPTEGLEVTSCGPSFAEGCLKFNWGYILETSACEYSNTQFSGVTSVLHIWNWISSLPLKPSVTSFSCTTLVYEPSAISFTNKEAWWTLLNLTSVVKLETNESTISML